MPLELVRAAPEHVPDISRIIFEAFKDIQDRHAFIVDIPSAQIAGQIAGMFIGRPDCYGITAILDGKIVGSNFVLLADEVAAVGPITIDPTCQNKGVGRALMQHIINWCLKNHGPMIRLVQEAFNMRSLALYTALGFTVVEPLVLMEVTPQDAYDPTVRPMEPKDLPACDELCRRITGLSRKNELAFILTHGKNGGSLPFVRVHENRLLAYVIPGFLGHAVAEAAQHLLATAATAACFMPPPAHRLFVPTRSGELFRQALAMKFRCLKPMSLMAMGPYTPPPGPAWTPSITY